MKIKESLQDYEKLILDIDESISKIEEKARILTLREEFISSEMKNLEDNIELLAGNEYKKSERISLMKTYTFISEKYLLFQDSYAKLCAIIKDYNKLKIDLINSKINNALKIDARESESKANSYFNSATMYSKEVEEKIKEKLEKDGY